MFTVKICDTAVHSVNTVAVVIAPVGDFSTWDGEINSIQRLTCLTVEKCHILRAVKDIAAAVAVIFVCIADDLSLAVLSSVGSLGDEFGFSVAVEVCNAHLGIMLTCTDILTEVYPPEVLAFESVAVDDNIVSLALL